MLIKSLNPMCMDCQKLQNGCEGTSCQSWTGCIFKDKSDENLVAVIKENTKQYLKNLGYSEEQTDFVQDIVSVVRPGVVLIKEKVCGKYTGKLSELYL